jgi:hypothetical protein
MIMQLAPILDHYHDAFHAKYGSKLLPGHLRAIDAITRCRTPEAGQMLVQCSNYRMSSSSFDMRSADIGIRTYSIA